MIYHIYIYVCIYSLNNKDKRRGLIAATGLVILFKLDSNRRFFDSYDHEIWWMTSQKIGHLFCTMPSFVHHFKAIGAVKLELQSRNAHFGSKLAIFVPCDLKFWWLTLKNNRAPILYYIKPCASFPSHQWIQTGVTVWKSSIWVKIYDFLSHVTLKFDRWPWKTKGCLFFATSSFAHHFVAIREFKLELQSGNVQFGSSMMTWSNGNIFRVTGPLWGEFTSHWLIPLTKTRKSELWCFLWFAPEQTVE